MLNGGILAIVRSTIKTHELMDKLEETIKNLQENRRTSEELAMCCPHTIGLKQNTTKTNYCTCILCGESVDTSKPKFVINVEESKITTIQRSLNRALYNLLLDEKCEKITVDFEKLVNVVNKIISDTAKGITTEELSKKIEQEYMNFG